MNPVHLDIALHIVEGQTKLLEQPEYVQHALMATLHVLSDNLSIIVNHIVMPSSIETNTFFKALFLLCGLLPLQLLFEMEVVLKNAVLLAHTIVYVHHSVLVPRLYHSQLF